jgi:hypothetical protein
MNDGLWRVGFLAVWRVVTERFAVLIWPFAFRGSDLGEH